MSKIIFFMQTVTWCCSIVCPIHELNFSSLIAVCTSFLCKWARRFLKSLAFNWRTQMCQNSRECPLVNFNYSQHAFALIQLNCRGKAEAQLLLAQSNGNSGITHNLTQHLYWNQNINLETTCLFNGRNFKSLWTWSKVCTDHVNNHIITYRKLKLDMKSMCFLIHWIIYLFISLFVFGLTKIYSFWQVHVIEIYYLLYFCSFFPLWFISILMWSQPISHIFIHFSVIIFIWLRNSSNATSFCSKKRSYFKSF